MEQPRVGKECQAWSLPGGGLHRATDKTRGNWVGFRVTLGHLVSLIFRRQFEQEAFSSHRTNRTPRGFWDIYGFVSHHVGYEGGKF